MADTQILNPGCESSCDDDDDDRDDDERGKRGKRGKRGHRGHTGPQGDPGAAGPPGTSINILKFSGATAISEIVVPSFLSDSGPGSTPTLVAPSYPAPVPYTVGSFTANIITPLVIDPTGFVQFQLFKNGVIIATITYNAGDTNGIKTTTFSPVSFAVGDTIDVGVVVAPLIEASLAVSAMVGP